MNVNSYFSDLRLFLRGNYSPENEHFRRENGGLPVSDMVQLQGTW